MNIIFKQDLKKRKQYLNCYARSKPLWKVKIAIMIILFIITLAIFVGLGYILSVIEKDSITIDIIFGFFLATLCIACFPFFMGLYFRNSARYHCAFPYSGMTNGILRIWPVTEGRRI